jgi:fucose permease
MTAGRRRFCFTIVWCTRQLPPSPPIRGLTLRHSPPVAQIETDRDARVRHGGRDAVTWFAYLLLGYFTYVVSIQGNILPFLRDELDLSYRAVSLHTSAIAVGIILIGLFGERVIRLVGRRPLLNVATLGSAAAAVLLTLAPSTAISIGSCFLFGVMGAFIPALVNGIFSDLGGRRRDIAFAEANAVATLFATSAPIVTGLCVWLGWGWRMAVLAGAATGVGIVIAFARTPVPPSGPAHEASSTPLPFAFWCYWTLLGMAVAVEFSAILWAPAYLEQVIVLDATSAAIGAAAFFAGMLTGRVGGAGLFRVVPTRLLFLAAAATLFAGFALYWGTAEPAIVIVGLFVVGLGTALLFPLALTFAIAAAGPAAERAAARVMLGPGLAILLAPPLLGAMADGAGLRTALLMTPAFMAVGVVAFFLGEAARRRAGD